MNEGNSEAAPLLLSSRASSLICHYTVYLYLLLFIYKL